MWNVNETEPLPAWFNEISLQIHFIIEENETKEEKAFDFPQVGYLF